MVRNSFGWDMIINDLKKNGGKLGACSVKVLRESERTEGQSMAQRESLMASKSAL